MSKRTRVILSSTSADDDDEQRGGGTPLRTLIHQFNGVAVTTPADASPTGSRETPAPSPFRSSSGSSSASPPSIGPAIAFQLCQGMDITRFPSTPHTVSLVLYVRTTTTTGAGAGAGAGMSPQLPSPLPITVQHRVIDFLCSHRVLMAPIAQFVKTDTSHALDAGVRLGPFDPARDFNTGAATTIEHSQGRFTITFRGIDPVIATAIHHAALVNTVHATTGVVAADSILKRSLAIARHGALATPPHVDIEFVVDPVVIASRGGTTQQGARSVVDQLMTGAVTTTDALLVLVPAKQVTYLTSNPDITELLQDIFGDKSPTTPLSVGQAERLTTTVQQRLGVAQALAVTGSSITPVPTAEHILANFILDTRFKTDGTGTGAGAGAGAGAGTAPRSTPPPSFPVIQFHTHAGGTVFEATPFSMPAKSMVDIVTNTPQRVSSLGSDCFVGVKSYEMPAAVVSEDMVVLWAGQIRRPPEHLPPSSRSVTVLGPASARVSFTSHIHAELFMELVVGGHTQACIRVLSTSTTSPQSVREAAARSMAARSLDRHRDRDIRRIQAMTQASTINPFQVSFDVSRPIPADRRVPYGVPPAVPLTFPLNPDVSLTISSTSIVHNGMMQTDVSNDKVQPGTRAVVRTILEPLTQMTSRLVTVDPQAIVSSVVDATSEMEYGVTPREAEALHFQRAQLRRRRREAEEAEDGDVPAPAPAPVSPSTAAATLVFDMTGAVCGSFPWPSTDVVVFNMSDVQARTVMGSRAFFATLGVCHPSVPGLVDAAHAWLVRSAQTDPGPCAAALVTALRRLLAAEVAGTTETMQALGVHDTSAARIRDTFKTAIGNATRAHATAMTSFRTDLLGPGNTGEDATVLEDHVAFMDHFRSIEEAQWRMALPKAGIDESSIRAGAVAVAAASASEAIVETEAVVTYRFVDPVTADVYTSRLTPFNAPHRTSTAMAAMYNNNNKSAVLLRPSPGISLLLYAGSNMELMSTGMELVTLSAWLEPVAPAINMDNVLDQIKCDPDRQVEILQATFAEMMTNMMLYARTQRGDGMADRRRTNLKRVKELRHYVATRSKLLEVLTRNSATGRCIVEGFINDFEMHATRDIAADADERHAAIGTATATAVQRTSEYINSYVDKLWGIQAPLIDMGFIPPPAQPATLTGNESAEVLVGALLAAPVATAGQTFLEARQAKLDMIPVLDTRPLVTLRRAQTAPDRMVIYSGVGRTPRVLGRPEETARTAIAASAKRVRDVLNAIRAAAFRIFNIIEYAVKTLHAEILSNDREPTIVFATTDANLPLTLAMISAGAYLGFGFGRIPGAPFWEPGDYAMAKMPGGAPAWVRRTHGGHSREVSESVLGVTEIPCVLHMAFFVSSSYAHGVPASAAAVIPLSGRTPTGLMNRVTKRARLFPTAEQAASPIDIVASLVRNVVQTNTSGAQLQNLTVYDRSYGDLLDLASAVIAVDCAQDNEGMARGVDLRQEASRALLLQAAASLHAVDDSSPHTEVEDIMSVLAERMQTHRVVAMSGDEDVPEAGPLPPPPGESTVGVDALIRALAQSCGGTALPIPVTTMTLTPCSTRTWMMADVHHLMERTSVPRVVVAHRHQEAVATSFPDAVCVSLRAMRRLRESASGGPHGSPAMRDLDIAPLDTSVSKVASVVPHLTEPHNIRVMSTTVHETGMADVTLDTRVLTRGGHVMSRRPEWPVTVSATTFPAGPLRCHVSQDERASSVAVTGVVVNRAGLCVLPTSISATETTAACIAVAARTCFTNDVVTPSTTFSTRPLTQSNIHRHMMSMQLPSAGTEGCATVFESLVGQFQTAIAVALKRHGEAVVATPTAHQLLLCEEDEDEEEEPRPATCLLMDEEDEEFVSSAAAAAVDDDEISASEADLFLASPEHAIIIRYVFFVVLGKLLASREAPDMLASTGSGDMSIGGGSRTLIAHKDWQNRYNIEMAVLLFIVASRGGDGVTAPLQPCIGLGLHALEPLATIVPVIRRMPTGALARTVERQLAQTPGPLVTLHRRWVPVECTISTPMGSIIVLAPTGRIHAETMASIHRVVVADGNVDMGFNMMKAALTDNGKTSWRNGISSFVILMVRVSRSRRNLSMVSLVVKTGRVYKKNYGAVPATGMMVAGGVPRLPPQVIFGTETAEEPREHSCYVQGDCRVRLVHTDNAVCLTGQPVTPETVADDHTRPGRPLAALVRNQIMHIDNHDQGALHPVVGNIRISSPSKATPGVAIVSVRVSPLGG